MAWVGDADVLARHGAGRQASPPTARRARRRVQRDLRELGPERDAGAAAHLGEHADRDAGQGRRRLAGSSAACSSISAALAERCELQARPTASRCRSASGSAWRSASSSSTARCATSSACATRAGATPAARRSGPTPSASSARFGVNLKQVYGATEASALIACQSDGEANPNTVGRPMPGHRGQDRRQRRGHAEGRPTSSSATTSRTRPRARR